MIKRLKSQQILFMQPCCEQQIVFNGLLNSEIYLKPYLSTQYEAFESVLFDFALRERLVKQN